MKEPLSFLQRIPVLPVTYGKARLVCLVKNINWAYVFWELLSEQVRDACQQVGPDYRKVLRVYKGDEKQREILSDVTVFQDIGAQYVYLPEPGQRYQVELMIIGGERAVSLLSSNFVSTPFGKISDKVDEEWATIDEIYQRYNAQDELGHASSPLLWNVSSPMAQHPTAKDDIDISLYTELIIYGKASPGSQVHVQGEAIAMKEDGSFSVRYAINDGTYVYPIKAVNSKGLETKTYVPVITRETY